MSHKSPSTVISHALEHYIDLKSGLIPLLGRVNKAMYAKLSTSLMALSNMSEAPEKITFILNTYGGDLYQALAIYDLIKRQELKTKIFINGPVMSAGTIIMAAGDERVMTPHSYLMYHFGTQTAESKQGTAHLNQMNDVVKDLYKGASKASNKIIESWFEKEVYYNASQALELSLVDRVERYEKEKTDEA